MLSVKELNTLIDTHKEELFDLLCRLIRINSENFDTHGNEEACAEYVAGLCRELGLETDLYSPMSLPNFTENPDYLPGRHLENRPNVTARWNGKSDEDSVMFMAHTDTVMIGDPKNWSFDPLAGIVRDGKIWGRGACDDKYGIATVLFLIKLLQEQGFTPKANILFTAYSDEEKGGSHGALAASIKYPCERIVNLDCKNFEVWHAASGGGEMTYNYHTKEPVDSAALTAEAIPVVMDVMERFKERRREELSANRFYKGTIIPDTAMRYMEIRAGSSGVDLGVGRILFVYYTDKTRDEIYAEFAEIEAELSARLAPMGIIGDGFKPATRFFHYGYAEPDCGNIRDMQKAALEATGRVITPCASCLSDLSVILKYGSKQAFGFGVGRDFTAYGGAHQPDEYINCDDLVELTKIVGAYILNIMGE